jgi:aspartate aminotransferase
MGYWNHVPMGPKDPILGLNESFLEDTFEGKISVGVGAYRDDNGKPWVLPSVRKAQEIVNMMDNEYPPITGVPAFVKQASILAYGQSSDVLSNKRVAACQSLSGTGALRLCGEYLARHSEGERPTVMLPNPTWGNHNSVFQHAGLDLAQYRYWHPDSLGLDLDGMLADLRDFKGKAAVLLHSCAHNPTGVDPTMDQWQQIADVCKEKGHFVIFDNAYQGFASGDAAKDARAINLFVEQGHLIALCQSFAKNFGLYGQRVGLFSIVCEDNDEKERVESQLKIIARAMYSNPPVHGARIVSTILADAELQAQWRSEIQLMAGRIMAMRSLLKEQLAAAGSTRNWDHITNQIGMFSYTGVTAEQCDTLIKDEHIYLTRNGRISMAGVTTKNVTRLAQAIANVTR